MRVIVLPREHSSASLNLVILVGSLLAGLLAILMVLLGAAV